MTLAEQTLPSSVSPPNLLPTKADVFSARSARLAHLAEGHSLGQWLGWLAELSAAQQKLLDQISTFGLPALEHFDPAQPPLAVAQQVLLDRLPAIYEALLAEFKPGGVTLESLTPGALAASAAVNLGVAAGQVPAVGRAVADLLVAACLQVLWAGAVRQLDIPPLVALHAVETCPCCGSAPVGSIVLAGDGKAGLRYQECSLCGTRWNAVRARCTLCDSVAQVNNYGLEGGSAAIQAESCDQCHAYTKTMYQNKDINVDPVADDLASLALDVLVGEQGYARGCPNLFLIEGEAVQAG